MKRSRQPGFQSLEKQAFRLPILGTLFFAFLLCAATGAETRYRVVDLGTLGGPSSRPYALNAKGAVAGEAETKQGQSHAFLWTADGGMKDLGTLGGRISRAYAVNDRGEVAGEAETSNGVSVAFVWTPDKGMRELPLPEEAIAAYAMGLNHFGVAVGAIETVDGSRPVFWDVDGIHQLSTNADQFGVCHAINDEGTAAGQVQPGAGNSNAFVSTSFSAMCVASSAVLKIWSQPGAVAGASSSAYAIAPDGQRAGYMETIAGQPRAYRMNGDSGANLDTMNNAHSCAYGMNGKGDVVGTFSADNNDDDRAFIHTAGGMRDLNELTDETDGWLLVEARAINDAGCIVGRAAANGRDRAVLLEPVQGDVRESSVAITQPANGARMPLRLPVRIVANAHAAAGVKKVTFLANGQTLLTVDEEPYEIDWKPTMAGVYDLTARVTDYDGHARKSARVQISVDKASRAPEVWMTAPLAVTFFQTGSTQELAAAASDADGRIAGMRLLVDGREVASTNGGDCFSFNWVAPEVPAGCTNDLAVTAVAIDNTGVSSTSSVLTVHVYPRQTNAVPSEEDLTP